VSTINIPAPKRASADRATVPVPPSTNNLFRTVGVRRFRTKEYVAWSQLAEPVLATIRPPESLPVVVVVRIAGKLNVQRDLDNTLKPVGDALVAAGVLPEDDVRHVVGWDVRYERGEGEPVATVFFRAETEYERHQRLYGIDSPNGDVIDWLYAWLENPTNAASQAALELFLARHGYEATRELFEKAKSA
jgi:Holliday junction resolvase RusA-like endonuclease